MRRLLLWIFRCWFGVRCARLEIGSNVSSVPPGVVMHIEYTCSWCGTLYESSVLVGRNDTYTQTPRKRVTDSRGAAEEARSR